MQSGQFEHDLFEYGSSRDVVQVRRETALKAAQGYVGKDMLLIPGQRVHIISIRLEDDPAYPGVRGRVIALCELVSKTEQGPFRPEMEYK